VTNTDTPFSWKAPAGGTWRVYIFNTYSHAGADGSNVNYLESRLAPAFIEIALEPYARSLGDRLGRSIPGDFIDNEGDYGWGLAWSATLDERYRDLQKFSGLLDYAKTFLLEKPGKSLQLDLGKVGHVAEVWVNGKSCGARLWGPHVFDIGDALRPGQNEVRIRVANLINNSYGEFTGSGLFGPVRLVQFQ
jgi:hypothetical protein